MQLLKNKQSHSYHCGYLEVPEKYAYLKDNAAKKKQKQVTALEGRKEGATMLPQV